MKNKHHACIPEANKYSTVHNMHFKLALSTEQNFFSYRSSFVLVLPWRQGITYHSQFHDANMINKISEGRRQHGKRTEINRDVNILFSLYLNRPMACSKVNSKTKL